MGYAVSTSAGTVADRVVDFLKRAGESTPREIQDALDVHQTELPKALEVAIREGAIVKRKDERFGRVTYCLGPSADVWKPLRTKYRGPLPRLEAHGNPVDPDPQQNSAATTQSSLATSVLSSEATQPAVVCNTGSAESGHSDELLPRDDGAVVSQASSEGTPPATLQPADWAPGAAKSVADNDAVSAPCDDVRFAIGESGIVAIEYAGGNGALLLKPDHIRRLSKFLRATEALWGGA